MTKKHPYTCPRCEYFTAKKGDMSKHLYDVKKPCPATKQDIELTDVIKQHILDNRVYKPTHLTTMNTHTKTIKKHISHALKVKCWDTHVGVDIGRTKCLCCNHNYITQHSFHCGHVVAESQGGSIDVENLRPICGVCNHSMGTQNMNEFKALQGFFSYPSQQQDT